jgi:hypothetical protein
MKVGDRIEFGGNLIKRRSGVIVKILPGAVKVEAEKLHHWEKPEDLIFYIVKP